MGCWDTGSVPMYRCSSCRSCCSCCTCCSCVSLWCTHHWSASLGWMSTEPSFRSATKALTIQARAWQCGTVCSSSQCSIPNSLQPFPTICVIASRCQVSVALAAHSRLRFVACVSMKCSPRSPTRGTSLCMPTFLGGHPAGRGPP